MPEKRIITGETYTDQRGSLRFFNQLDMSEIVRFYEIAPADSEQIRGWQGHREEKKWFYCLNGSFIINIVELDNFERPSSSLQTIKFKLTHSQPKTLCITGGYASAIKALENNSRLQVFSNFSLQESKDDDYRFPVEQWSADWKT